MNTDTHQPAGTRSPSGVFIADDFRSNLIIDRYDPVFSDMRASKLEHLRSANSEDAVTWNVFRSLRQVAPEDWLPTAWSLAFPELERPADLAASVKLWESIRPPRALLAAADEGQSEVDVVIETANWVWFIEAKYRGDVSTRTTTRPDRDQVLRNIDVGTHYAGERRFFFSLLVQSAEASPIGAERVRLYSDKTQVASILSHRPDGLVNLAGVGMLTWASLGAVLKAAAANAKREDERGYAEKAHQWLAHRGLA